MIDMHRYIYTNIAMYLYTDIYNKSNYRKSFKRERRHTREVGRRKWKGKIMLF